MDYILVLFDSGQGSTQKLAYLFAEGIESTGMQAKLRCVPKVSNICEATQSQIPVAGCPYVTLDDLKDCKGLALGSPTYFGNMSSHMKYFLEQTSMLWFNGDLIGKPATVFTSTGSLHGGHESTLLSMMLPLYHHGMVICSLPYPNSGLMHTKTGGSPYGVSHYDSSEHKAISQDEQNMAKQMGKHLASIAAKLSYS